MTAAKKTAFENDHVVGFYEVGDEEYRNDPCLVPSLNATTALELVTKCPAKAWYQHPRFGGQRRKDTAAFDRGSLIHALVLGKGKAYQALPFDDFKKQAAKDARDRARALGRTPVRQRDFVDAQEAAEAIRSKMKELGFTFNKARTELGAFWIEEADDGTPVQCRAMFDYWREPIGLDLKSIGEASQHACEKSSADYGYALRDAAYRSAIRHIKPALVGRERFEFLFAEYESPYLVTHAELDATFRQIGELQWRRAINTWAACVRDDAWPDYSCGEKLRLSPPAWLVARELKVLD